MSGLKRAADTVGDAIAKTFLAILALCLSFSPYVVLIAVALEADDFLTAYSGARWAGVVIAIAILICVPLLVRDRLKPRLSAAVDCLANDMPPTTGSN